MRTNPDASDSITSTRAQSTVIGVLLLTAVVIITVSTIGIFFVGTISEQADASGPLVDVSMTNETIEVRHVVGDSVDIDDLTLIVDNDSVTERYAFGPANVTGDGDGQFDPGETFARNHSLGGGAFRVRILDTGSNSLLHSERLDAYAVDNRDGDDGDDSTGGSDPMATFVATPDDPTVGDPVTFDARGSSDPDGTITSYEWEFDDGTTASGEVVGHTYSSSGTYLVTLTVTDDDGETASTTERIEVTEPMLLQWRTASDWDDASTEDGVVHQPFGDRDPHTIQLGYPATDDGLVGYWPLDENVGATSANDTTGANDGAIEGSSPGTAGIFGSTGYDFGGDGSGDRVDLGDAGAGTDQITVATWVRPTHASGTSPSSGPERILMRGDGSGGNSAFDLNWRHDGEGGNTAWFLRIDGGWHGAVDTQQRPADEWHFLVGTYDGEQVSLYVDGTLVDSTPVQGTIDDSSVNTYLSQPPGASGQEFEGSIDEPRMYDRALNNSEIEALYDAAGNGSYVSGWRTADRKLSADRLVLDGVRGSVPTDSSASIVVESDVGGDGQVDERSDPIDLDPGQVTYDVSGIATNSSTMRLRVSMESGSTMESPVLSNVTISEGSGSDPGDFEISSLEAPSSTEPGVSYEVSAVVENAGSAPATQSVRYQLDGTILEQTDVTLAPSESTTVEFEPAVPSGHSGGEVDHGAFGGTNEVTGTISVEVAPTIDQFDVSDGSYCLNSPWGGCFLEGVEYSVSWAVSDANSDVNTTTIRLVDSNGEVANEAENDESESGDATLTDSVGYGDDYTIEIEVVDERGDNETDAVDDEADGTGP